MSYGTTSDLLTPAAVSWTGGLAGFRAQVERNQEHARRLVEGLDDEAFRWRPEPRRWSMAECFEHMDVSLGLYLPAIDGAVERAKAQSWRCSPPPPRPGFLAKWFVGLLEPPPKRRFRAFGPFVPQQVRPLADALPRFLRSRDELLRRLRDAEGLDLQRAKLRSPAVPLLRFSLVRSLRSSSRTTAGTCGKPSKCGPRLPFPACEVTPLPERTVAPCRRIDSANSRNQRLRHCVEIMLALAVCYHRYPSTHSEKAPLH